MMIIFAAETQSYQLSFVGDKVPDYGVCAEVVVWICPVRDLQDHHFPLDHGYFGLRKLNLSPSVWMEEDTTVNSYTSLNLPS